MGPIPCHIKGYKIGICCFSDKHAALRSKGLASSQDNMPWWNDMSICGLLFQ